MHLDIKDTTNILLAKKALNDICRIIYDKHDERNAPKIRNFLCPCGFVSTSEDEKEINIVSKSCDL